MELTAGEAGGAVYPAVDVAISDHRIGNSNYLTIVETLRLRVNRPHLK